MRDILRTVIWLLCALWTLLCSAWYFVDLVRLEANNGSAIQACQLSSHFAVVFIAGYVLARALSELTHVELTWFRSLLKMARDEFQTTDQKSVPRRSKRHEKELAIEDDEEDS